MPKHSSGKFAGMVSTSSKTLATVKGSSVASKDSCALFLHGNPGMGYVRFAPQRPVRYSPNCQRGRRRATSPGLKISRCSPSPVGISVMLDLVLRRTSTMALATSMRRRVESFVWKGSPFLVVGCGPQLPGGSGFHTHSVGGRQCHAVQGGVRGTGEGLGAAYWLSHCLRMLALERSRPKTEPGWEKCFMRPAGARGSRPRFSTEPAGLRPACGPPR